jgi:uncharacterized protein YdaU (DUF1376 family)
MKDPAFLFYPGDWLGGTIGMSFEEKGAYMELLMMQFTRGHMTSHMIGQTVGQLWVKLQDKFIQDENGLWYNVRLDIEKEKRKNFVTSRKNNKEGKNQHNKEGKEVGHMTSHMENENKDVNVISINTLVDRKGIEDAIFSDKVFISELSRMNPDKDIKKAWNECYQYHSQKPTKLAEWEWRQKLGTWLIKFEGVKSKKSTFQQ